MNRQFVDAIGSPMVLLLEMLCRTVFEASSRRSSSHDDATIISTLRQLAGDQGYVAEFIAQDTSPEFAKLITYGLFRSIAEQCKNPDAVGLAMRIAGPKPEVGADDDYATVVLKLAMTHSLQADIGGFPQKFGAEVARRTKCRADFAIESVATSLQIDRSEESNLIRMFEMLFSD